MIRKMEFARTVNKDFFSNPIDTPILHAIEGKRAILVQHGGKSDEFALDEYLAHFQDLKRYLDAGVMNIRDVYGDYSHYVEAAYSNTEVMNYIHELRTREKDSAYYEDFELLARQMIDIDRGNR